MAKEPQDLGPIGLNADGGITVLTPEQAKASFAEARKLDEETDSEIEREKKTKKEDDEFLENYEALKAEEKG